MALPFGTLHSLLFDMRLDANGNNALYEIVSNWNELEKMQLPCSDDTLPMALATLLNTIFFKLGVE